MYTLFYLPGASSLAVHAVLRELEQPFNLIERDSTYDFTDLNPVGAVPVLIDDDLVIREGAAILLHVLDKHETTLLPRSGSERTQAIESLMFANATLQGAYRSLFFVQGYVLEEPARTHAFDTAIQWIEQLWAIVDRRIGVKPFLDGSQVSAADFVLTVCARWNASLPARIRIGANAERLVERTTARPAFQQALAAESSESHTA
ncbi:MAG: glutathione S-transferase family protein [Pseudomonadales bacterium]